MKKRIAILTLALMLASAPGLFAFGIGLQADGNAGGSGFTPGVSLTLKTDKIPLVFALNWNIQDSVQTFGLTGDYWLLNKSITRVGDGSLNWFFGLGFFTNMTFANNFNMNAGIRVPVGLNMFIIDNVLEPYIQIAPSFGVRVVPSLGVGNVFFPISAGFRVWFK